MDPIRILFLAASPAVDRGRLDRELRAIQDKIRAAEHRDPVELVSRWAVRPDDLMQALLEMRPHVLPRSRNRQRRPAFSPPTRRGRNELPFP